MTPQQNRTAALKAAEYYNRLLFQSLEDDKYYIGINYESEGRADDFYLFASYPKGNLKRIRGSQLDKKYKVVYP